MRGSYMGGWLGLKKKSGEQLKKDAKMEAKILAKFKNLDSDHKALDLRNYSTGLLLLWNF